MNIWEHPYPEDLKATLADAERVAKQLYAQLENGPKLSELFELQNDKNYRNPDFFERLGVTTHKIDKNKEMSGIYLFGQQKDATFVPMYVGISNTVDRRMRQHGWGYGHNQPSLAYLIARHHEDYSGSRNAIAPEIMEHYKRHVREFHVSVVTESDPFRLHFFETAVAGILKTKWNKFKTH